MFWRAHTSSELGDVDRNVPVVLPLAAIEQHGPHLAVETDTRIATILCQAIDKLAANNALFLPVMAYGCSAHHMSFPGTLSLKHDTWLRMVDDIASSVFQQGFNTFVLFNAHGGNQAVGQLALERLGERYPDKNIAMVTWWKLDSKVLMQLSQTRIGGVGHACEFETSLMLAHAPESVRQERIPENRANRPTHPWAEGDMLRGGRSQLFSQCRSHGSEWGLRRAFRSEPSTWRATHRSSRKAFRLHFRRFVPSLVIENRMTQFGS